MAQLFAGKSEEAHESLVDVFNTTLDIRDDDAFRALFKGQREHAHQELVFPANIFEMAGRSHHKAPMQATEQQVKQQRGDQDEKPAIDRGSQHFLYRIVKQKGYGALGKQLPEQSQGGINGDDFQRLMRTRDT